MEQYGKPEYSIDSTSAILKSVFSRVKDFSETGKDGKEIHVSGFVIVFEDVYHVGLLNGFVQYLIIILIDTHLKDRKPHVSVELVSREAVNLAI